MSQKMISPALVSRMVFSVAGIFFGLGLLWLETTQRIPEPWKKSVHGAGDIIIILASGVLVLQSVSVAFKLYNHRYERVTADDLRERRIRTQLQYLERIIDLFVVIVTIATMLMSFEDFKRLGGSLLASAGLVSVIVGFAAQRSLGNLIAGFQVAFTQPIRLGDVVVAENEWGTIEEINLTYVVIRVWDLRRLILPITYFLEKPFQNWTRTNASLIGTVFFSVDYSLPLEPIRKELQRLAEASLLWDRKTCIMQVTDLTESTMTLRVLVSAKDSPTCFDLRCEIREKLMTFIEHHWPEALPRRRLEASVTADQRESSSAD
jgi:small-conductance mechanosensitive channel